jgi:hypothetical protein
MGGPDPAGAGMLCTTALIAACVLDSSGGNSAHIICQHAV